MYQCRHRRRVRAVGHVRVVAVVDELMVPEQTAPGQLDLSGAIAELASIVLAHESLELVLGRLTAIAKRTVPGAFEVSVTMRDRNPVTAATTAEFACAVDEAQYEAGYGPCLDALRFGETVVVDNQLTETRWPEYSPRAAEAGVGSSVSVPLEVVDEHVAALNIYGDRPYAFGPEAIRAAEDLAIYAAIVLNNADLYYSATSLAEQMADAMSSRAVIEQAKGVLMAGRHCDADEAFAILVKLSQQTHRKLRAVAQAIIDQITTGA
jgi:GAF domain-containing protein